jgi:predicted dehydrogenase
MTGRPAVGVAVVGLGVGAQHARAFQADPRCQLRWLYDLDSAKAQALAAELGAGAAAPDFETILNSPEVQIVSLASYDGDHARQAVAALQAGKHVFVEKPLCQTLTDLQAIKQAWQARAGALKLACNLVLRAAPLYRWLHENIRAGRLGTLYAFDGEYLYGRLHKITAGWRSQTENYSVMQGGGIHLIDLMLWLTGERPATVSAVGNNISTAGTDFRYADYVSASLRGASGLVSRITANFGCVHRHQHIVRVYGTEATFLYDDAGPRLHVSRDPTAAAQLVDLSALPAGKGDLIPAFVSAVIGDEDIQAQTQAAFEGVSISAACDLALQTQKLEAISYV